MFLNCRNTRHYVRMSHLPLKPHRNKNTKQTHKRGGGGGGALSNIFVIQEVMGGHLPLNPV